MMDRREEDLLKNQTLERKALPKRIRQEMRAREMMFRESMRISTPNIHEMLKPTEEKERIKKVLVRSYLSKVCRVSLLQQVVLELRLICSLVSVSLL